MADVFHNVQERRFEMEQDGHLAVLEYTIEGNLIVFYHTGVPTALEGRGIGSQLAKAGLAYAQEKDHRVKPQCWFVAGYIERHPEYKPLLA